MDGDDDPYDWSIDEVVAYLCHASSAPESRSVWPDADFLEETLRENEIDGETLLTDVDKNSLLADLGIRSLGQRGKIFRAIQNLQRRSQKYRESRPDDRLASYALSTPSIAPLTQIQSPATPLQSINFPSPVIAEAQAPKHPEPHLRPREQYAVGADGRKRRKLALGNPNGDSNAASKEKFSGHSSQDSRWYVGPRKVKMSDMFYKDMEDSDDESFVLFGSNSSRGQKRFVNSCMRQYFQKQPQAVQTPDGKDAVALLPYKGSRLVNDTQYFTLFAKNGSEVSVTKENISDWPQLSGNPDKFDYLLDKYPPEQEDDALPAYGDSGSEGDYDSDTLREIEEEKQEERAKAKVLSGAEVDDIMDEYDSSLSSKWHTEKLPIEQRKARRIWLRSRKKNSMHSEIRSSTNKIARLQGRLREIRLAVKKSPWMKVDNVRQQCKSMDLTIFDREREKWLISVLESDTCPPKATDVPTAPRVKRPRRIVDDEESLGSGSESQFEDDFIVPDDEDDTVTVPSNKTNQALHRSVVSSALPIGHSSDSEGDIVAPGRKRKRHSSEAPDAALPKGSTETPATVPTPSSTARPRHAPAHQPQDVIELIDLTNSADEAEPYGDVQTPPLNPVTHHDQPFTPKLRLDADSHQSNIPVVKRSSPSVPPANMGHNELLKNEDGAFQNRSENKRLLSEVVNSISADEVHDLREFVGSKTRKHLWNCTQKALVCLNNNKLEIDGLEKHESHKHMRIASLYIQWYHKRLLNKKGIPRKLVKSTLNGERRFGAFHTDLSACFQPSVAAKLELPASNSQAQVAKDNGLVSPVESTSSKLDESDSVEEVSSLTPHKRRKRPVKQSQEALDAQKSAQRRAENQGRQQKRLARKLSSMGVSNSDPSHQAVSFDDPVLYLDPHIGGRVKPHQLAGIQFMWRELIKDEKRQGCLLAHTMGLGKTMQVISLLVTIADAAASHNPKVKNQVPEELRVSRTLVLCPSSLIENWWEEFMIWTPQGSRKNLGQVRRVQSTLEVKGQEVHSWHSEGGVLLMSYDIFRTVVHNKATKARLPPLHTEQHERIKSYLLEGPNIIVADEAHKMKNQKSGISQASMLFKSRSRIALTGSPLANNLTDYYAMIEWIAPRYLGDFVQFKANYVEPITQGLYTDSTTFEKRKSLKKLQVLKRDLDPKVNRADISVLEHDLPPKVEFVITVPLTPLQEQAYKLYVAALKQGELDGGNATLWAWLANLSLLCNHPYCLMKKLSHPDEDMRKTSGASSPDSETEAVDDAPISRVLPSEMISSLKELFTSVNGLRSLRFSHKTQILDQIITESIAAGDRVLIFSHSIPTLNYIERMLHISNRKFSRLDGHTRICDRQAATKSFNQADSDKYVYLISTKAGGLGLNIPGANRVVLFDFDFTPSWEEQAVGRAYRLGQKKPVFVYRFISGGTFQDVTYNKTVFKMQLSSRVVDKKNPIPSASKSKDYLFEPKPVEQSDLSEFKGKDPAVLDKILAKQDNIREIALTETFQREDNDKLTPEEEKDVQQELDDERLKRNDPLAWEKKKRARELQEAATYSAQRTHMSSAYTSPRIPLPLTGPLTNGAHAYTASAASPLPFASPFPQSPNITNVGPHSRAPDTSHISVAASQTLSASNISAPPTVTSPGMSPGSLGSLDSPTLLQQPRDSTLQQLSTDNADKTNGISSVAGKWLPGQTEPEQQQTGQSADNGGNPGSSSKEGASSSKPGEKFTVPEKATPVQEKRGEVISRPGGEEPSKPSCRQQ